MESRNCVGAAVYEFGKYILDIVRNWKEIPNLGFGYLVKRILCTSQATDLGGWNRCTQVSQGLRNQFITKNIGKQYGECWMLMFMNCSFILVCTCLGQPVDMENSVNGDATCGFVGALPATVWMAWRQRVFPRYPAEGFPQLLQLLPAPGKRRNCTPMSCYNSIVTIVLSLEIIITNYIIFIIIKKKWSD